MFLRRERSDPKERRAADGGQLHGRCLTCEVGVCRMPSSYGLGKVLHIHHCIANCIAFDKLEDVYGENDTSTSSRPW